MSANQSDRDKGRALNRDSFRRGARAIASTLCLTVLFFAVALASRVPAVALSDPLLHAVVAAPFYSFLANAWTVRDGRIWQAPAAFALVGLALFPMSPAMGFGFLLPAAVAAAIAAFELPRIASVRREAVAFVLGAALYFANVAVGMASGTVFLAGIMACIEAILKAVLACALALLGLLVADLVCSRARR